MPQGYEEHFTAFIDFLGFTHAIDSADDTARLGLLNLLRSVAALRSEFSIRTTANEAGSKTTFLQPAVSTFSDHIVISYPLRAVQADGAEDDVPFFVIGHFGQLLSAIARSALRLGFLIRGGATIDKLYHSGGVVFGEAMVEAFRLESRIAVYPRVVLSNRIVSRESWKRNEPFLDRDADGIFHLNYFPMMFLQAGRQGETFGKEVHDWFQEVVPIIQNQLKALENTDKLAELAKWAWFARQFRNTMERMNPKVLQSIGISVDVIPWP